MKLLPASINLRARGWAVICLSISIRCGREMDTEEQGQVGPSGQLDFY